MSPKNSCFSHQWNTLPMNKQPPAIQYTEIMESGLWNSLNFLKNHSGHITAWTYVHIACSLPRERSHHLPWQSCAPGAYLILMNSRFPHNYLSPGLWENKQSGTGLIWLHCHSLDRAIAISLPQYVLNSFGEPCCYAMRRSNRAQKPSTSFKA